MTALADAEADILASTHWKELIALDTNCISSDCCNCIIGAEPINTSTADEDFIEGQSETNGISSLTFDSCGKHLAAGMKNGKIVLYRLDDGVNTISPTSVHEHFETKDITQCDKTRHGPSFQRLLCWQSHRPEFDYLKSLDIEESINCISFFETPGRAHLLLSANDKTIKIWKVKEKPAAYSSASLSEADMSDKKRSFNLPKRLASSSSAPFRSLVARPRKCLKHAHAFNINSMSPNSDGETFISADDLTINLWNIDVCDRTFPIVDIKPENMGDLTEVVTTAVFHPCNCSLLLWGSSKGIVRLADLRKESKCKKHIQSFDGVLQRDVANSVFSEITSSVASATFSSDGNSIISRDYLSVKIWDVRSEARPVETIYVHEHIRGHLAELYDNDCIFDKFHCATSSNANRIITGSYNDIVHIYDRNLGVDVCIEVGRSNQSPLRMNTSRDEESALIQKERHHEADDRPVNFTKKTLHVAMHPKGDVAAVATGSKFYIYQQSPLAVGSKEEE